MRKKHSRSWPSRKRKVLRLRRSKQKAVHSRRRFANFAAICLALSSKTARSLTDSLMPPRKRQESRCQLRSERQLTQRCRKRTKRRLFVETRKATQCLILNFAIQKIYRYQKAS